MNEKLAAMLNQPMKLQVGDKVYEEGVDFFFNDKKEVIMKNAPAEHKPKRWWQFWRKKQKPVSIDFLFK